MATKRRACSKTTKPVAKKTTAKKPVATRKPKEKKFLVTTDASGNIKTVKSV